MKGTLALYGLRFEYKTFPIQTLLVVNSWRSVYHYYTTSFSKAWTQVLRRFKSCLIRVRDSRWWESVTMVQAENKAKCRRFIIIITMFRKKLYEIKYSTKLFLTLIFVQLYKKLCVIVKDFLNTTLRNSKILWQH